MIQMIWLSISFFSLVVADNFGAKLSTNLDIHLSAPIAIQIDDNNRFVSTYVRTSLVCYRLNFFFKNDFKFLMYVLKCFFSFCCCTVHYLVLFCFVVFCIVLYCTLPCIVLYCFILYCIVLYCIVLYCTVLFSVHFKNTSDKKTRAKKGENRRKTVYFF